MKARAVSTSLLQEDYWPWPWPWPWRRLWEWSQDLSELHHSALPFFSGSPPICQGHTLLLHAPVTFRVFKLYYEPSWSNTDLQVFAVVQQPGCPVDLDFNPPPHLSPQTTEVVKTWSAWNGRGSGDTTVPWGALVLQPRSRQKIPTGARSGDCPMDSAADSEMTHGQTARPGQHLADDCH